MGCRAHNNCRTWTLFALCLVTVSMCIGFGYWWYKNDTIEPQAAGSLLTPAQCTDQGGRAYGGNCYTTNTLLEKGWEDAEQACRELAGNLVSILSQDENDFVGSLPTSTTGMWIGLQKTSGLDVKYLWSDGTAELTGDKTDQPYASWAANMPGAGPGKANVGCTYLQKPTAGDSPRWYITKVCTETRVFTCKHALASTPSRPNNVSGVAAAGGVTVQWRQPTTNGGRNLTNFTVRVTANQKNWPLLLPKQVVVPNDNCTACSITVTDLQPHTSYEVAVAATNEVGTSPFQAATAEVQAGARSPDAPTLVTVQNANAECVVRFPNYPPTFDGGSPVVTFQINAVGLTIPAISGAALNKTAHFVSGLTNGQTYSLTVVAANAVGSSGPSIAVMCMPTNKPPSKPQLNNIISAFRNATVNVSQTSNDTMRAYAQPVCTDQETCPPTVVSAPSNELQAFLILANLSTHQTYVIYVEAERQMDGDNFTSSPAFLQQNELESVAVLAPQEPSAVRNVRGEAAGLDINVRFTYPLSDGDSPLLYFSLTVQDDNGTQNNLTQVAVIGASEGVILVDGDLLNLTARTNYMVVLTAYNSVGASVQSPVLVIQTGTTAPKPPRDVTVVAGERKVTISWKPPADFGANKDSASVAIAKYMIFPSPASFLSQNHSLTATSAGCPCAGLSPSDCSETCSYVYLMGVGSEHRQYEFYVLATSNATDVNETTSAASNPSLPVTVLATKPVDPPTSVAAISLSRAINVSFLPPIDNGGDPISNYSLFLVGATASLASSVSAQEFVLVQNLDARVTYQFQVRAENMRGSGPFSAAISASPLAGPPSVPLDVRVQPGDKEVRITYTAPLEDGGANISNYTAKATQGDFKATSSSAADMFIVVTGLTNGVKYNFQVLATNSLGLSGPLSPISQEVKTGRQFTTLEYVTGVSATVITLMIVFSTCYCVWWAWVEKELCWDDGDPHTRANAKKRKEEEAKAKAEAEAKVNLESGAGGSEGAVHKDGPMDASGPSTPAAADLERHDTGLGEHFEVGTGELHHQGALQGEGEYGGQQGITNVRVSDKHVELQETVVE
eukprot:gb/GEZN01001070.1/.p1 GENE.gb/GEZN01001070.1/~~gb/GEZN01001070.1/.p1  ORF type:complete len:1073 (-),score=126.01 gb/GEZN01001070.1/:105-3323(-)